MSNVPIVRRLDREPVEVVELRTPKCANVCGTAPCTATFAAGGQCFNTRATCLSPADFQARPLTHLTPDRILSEGNTGTTDFNGEALYVVEVELFVPLNPDGCVFEAGGTGTGIYIGFTSGDLVVRAGDGSSATPTGAARFSVDSSVYEGKTYTLIAVFEYDSGTACTVTAYLFDPIELELTLLGTDTSSTDPASLFDTGGYGVGTVNTAAPVGESTADYNGNIDLVRMYDNQAVTLFPSQDAYRRRYFFDDGRKAAPADSIYLMPILQSASTVGSRINLTGADDRMEPLGRRAYFECSLADGTHSDFPYDPYRTSRTYNPLKKGTFLPKLLAREKFGLTRALIKRYTGYDGQTLAEMRAQTYIVDRTNRGKYSISIKSRDVISLTEFRRAQVPAPTSGLLDADLTDSATTLFMAGDVTDQYTPTGTLRINEELMTYAGRTYDATDDQTDFTGLTRGTDGSEAAAHSTEDNAQLCRRYTAARIKTILQELLITDSKIPAQLVDLAKIVSEDDKNLAAYVLTTLITEPTGVDRLIGELAESCAFYLWWNERSQIVDMQAIKPLTDVSADLTDEANVIGDSLSLEDHPKERISTLSLYYNPRNFADDLDKPANFKQQLIPATSTNNDPDQYAKLPQIREIFSRWITSNAQANQTGARYINRYTDVPIYAKLALDAKDGELWVGDFVTLATDQLLTGIGDRDVRRWLIVEAEEPEPGHAQRVTLSDVTLDGLIYVITENGIGEYTVELFADRNAFITDNDGLNPDGTRGARIA